MNIERLRKIIAYSDLNKARMKQKVNEFYFCIGMAGEDDILNVLQIARQAFREKKYLVLEIPLADEEIGAFCYRGDAMNYLILNSSLPCATAHFAVCHELYHVYFQEGSFGSKIEFANDHYFEHEDEFSANLFAGMLLMPEVGFTLMYKKFKEESGGEELDTIFRLMNYYQVPYMSVLIRCCELELFADRSLTDELLNIPPEIVKKRFSQLWLDGSILEASGKDDFLRLKELVEFFGKQSVEEAYLNERKLSRVLRNMNVLYSEIKGDC